MMSNPTKFSGNSMRELVYGRKGMVATTNPYASQAGIQVMKAGGNAFDAAVAAAAALVVVEPTGCGLGSDVFAILSTKGKLHGLNGSGYSPKGLTNGFLHGIGLKEVPRYGPLPVTVPGAVASWRSIVKGFGKLSLGDLLQPAIRLAEEGHPVQPVISGSWEKALENQKNMGDDKCFLHWFDTFTIDGRAPRPGQLWRNPDLARTLRKIADSGGEEFYGGDLAERIVSFLKDSGGIMTMEDLMDFSPQWVEPISVGYRGYDIWELPPNGQGINALLALSILDNLPVQTSDKVQAIHNSIEAMKLGFEHGIPLVGDPGNMEVDFSELLSKDHGRERAAQIAYAARIPECRIPSKGGTVYLAAADGEGNMISFIQSNYRGFGSGLVVPGTGITLNNRGFDFSMDKESRNFLEGRKRPYNTIMPGFITRDGEALGPFGLMGGYMQPQGHIQLLVNVLEGGLNPQEALDHPRWQWTGDRSIAVEKDFPEELREGLQNRGHRVIVSKDTSSFGRAQMIIRGGDGGLYGAGEKRADSLIATW